MANNPNIQTITNLEDLILKFDQDRKYFGDRISEEDAMKVRDRFVSDFPADKIMDMKIEDYVVGKIDPRTGLKNENNFCYRIEFKVRGFGGIGGTPAPKYGIYCDKRTQQYEYDKEKYDSADSAFESIRSQINTILEAGRKVVLDNDWREFASTLEGKFDIHRHVRSKILAVYYPNDFLQIHSEKDVRRILNLVFGVRPEEMDKGIFLNQHKLLELKDKHHVMKKWSTLDYSFFIWNVTDSGSEGKNELSKSSIWVVRAGRNGRQEETALGNDIITIGWNELSNLADFKSKPELREYYRKMIPYETDEQIAQAVGQIWSFIREIRVGDIVVLPLLSGGTEHVAVCKVEGEYEDREITNEVKKVREVEWLKKDIPVTEFDTSTLKSLRSSRTVYSIRNKDNILSILKALEKYQIHLPYDDFGLATGTQQTAELETGTFLLLMQQPDTRWNDKAGIEYEFGDNVPNNKRVVPGARVVFYSTRDHKGDREESFMLHGFGKISSTVDKGVDGKTPTGKDITKKVAIVSEYTPLNMYELKRKQVTETIKGLSTFNNQNAIITISKEVYNLIVGNDLDARNLSKPTDLVSLAKDLHLTVNYLEEIETRLVEKGQIIFYGPPGTGKTYVAKAFGDYFAGPSNVEIVQFHQSYGYEDFVEGIRPNDRGGFSIRPGIFRRFVRKCQERPNERFLMIIDEINRGDIAKIFGELIHLLLYRGKEITLTYSGSDNDKFSIPSNLYIIATMNSQDRSVAFLDYANRRRFSMIKFYPNMGVLSEWLHERSRLGNVNKFVEVLDEINSLIKDRLGEDFQIGHSYFMEKDIDVDKVNRIIEFDIKPLLEQYFFAKKDEQLLSEMKENYLRRLLEAAATKSKSSE
jgi:hypothetical protein